jgi:hypothetical protein
VRLRVGPALVKGRLQPIGWMAGLLQFFQVLLAELGAARRRSSGWSVGVVLLVLVLGDVPAYFRPLLAGLDAGEDVEVLERLTVGVVAVHTELLPHLHRQADDQNSAIQGRRRRRVSIPWPRIRRCSPDDRRSPPVCRATCCTPPA